MDKIEELQNGIGALAEVLAMFYNALIGAGMDEQVALDLTFSVVKEIFVGFMKNNEED